MPVSVEVIDAINTISELSGGVSVDITQLPEAINITTNTTKQQLLQDSGFLAALLTSATAFIGNLCMGGIAIWTTMKANKNQEKIIQLTQDYELKRKEIEIRAALTASLFKMKSAAYKFEIDLEKCLETGSPEDTSKPDSSFFKNIQRKRIDDCVHSFQILQDAYNALHDLVSRNALFVDYKKIMPHEFLNLYNTYLFIGERIKTHSVFDLAAIESLLTLKIKGQSLCKTSLSDSIENILNQIIEKQIEINVSQGQS